MGYEGVVQLGFYAESLSGGFFDGIDVFFTNVEVKEKMTFDAEFIVDDEAGDPIENAIITLNDTEYPAGQYLIEDLLPGTYDYIVSKDGYADESGELSIVDQDVTIEVTMLLDVPVFILTFVVEDEDGIAVTDAVITVDDMENDPGDYVFEDLEAGTYDYTVNREGYFDESGEAEIIDEDVTVTVVLEEEPYTLDLTVNPANAGTVAGAGDYLAGTEVDIEALANDGYVFVNWTDQDDNVVSDDAETTFVMPESNTTLTANFELIDYSVTVHVDPEEAGAVIGEGSYNMGDQVTVEATAAEGYEFVNWTDQDDIEMSDDEEYTFTMPAENVVLTANFEPLSFNLSLAVSPDGTGSVEGDGVYLFGEEVLIEAVPETGYAFVSWTDADGDVVSDSPSESITMPAEDLTLTANFELADYTLSLFAEPEEGGEVSGEGTYQMGDEVTVLASANEGYEFMNWTNQDDEVVADTEEYSFTMPAEDVTLIANFEQLSYTLSLSAEPETGGVLSGEGMYFFGEEVTVIAEANVEYEFEKWADEHGEEVSQEAEYTFTMPSDDKHLVAYFENVTAITEPVVPAVVVYPNPASQYLNIESTEPLSQVSVYNLAGQLVIDLKVSSSDVQIQVNSLENGLYLLRLYHESGVIIDRFEILK